MVVQPLPVLAFSSCAVIHSPVKSGPNTARVWLQSQFTSRATYCNKSLVLKSNPSISETFVCFSITLAFFFFFFSEVNSHFFVNNSEMGLHLVLHVLAWGQYFNRAKGQRRITGKDYYQPV